MINLNQLWRKNILGRKRPSFAFLVPCFPYKCAKKKQVSYRSPDRCHRGFLEQFY